jgi:hypothetical protein
MLRDKITDVADILSDISNLPADKLTIAEAAEIAKRINLATRHLVAAYRIHLAAYVNVNLNDVKLD